MSGGLVPSNVPSKWLWSPHAGVCAAVRRCARWVDKWCQGCTVGETPRDPTAGARAARLLGFNSPAAPATKAKMPPRRG